jgi:spore coat polysaccharide biosynthesis protein SpsF
MRIVAIIQARMNSTRLPGKVLADLGGRTMLARVVQRVRGAGLVDHVVVATSLKPADDPIQEECTRLAVDSFRGDESDVLDRFHRAAEVHRAEGVVRITADCPLADPEVIDRVVRAFLERRPDFASNTLCRTYPRGLDVEVLTAQALATAWRHAREPYQRVHVTPYLYQHPERFRLLSLTVDEDLDNPPTGDYEERRVLCEHPERSVVLTGEEVLTEHPTMSHWRWTVDAPADLEFVREVYRRLGSAEPFSWRDVCRLIRRHPYLAEINGSVRQKDLMEG